MTTSSLGIGEEKRSVGRWIPGTLGIADWVDWKRWLATVLCLAASCAGLRAAGFSGLEIRFERNGKQVLTEIAKGRGAKIKLPGPLKEGDRLSISGASDLRVGLGKLPVAEVHAPGGDFMWVVGKGAASVLPPELFSADEIELRVMALQEKELGKHRNLTVNPFAPLVADTSNFPNVTASSETRGEGAFAARNAIDGFEENKGHGGWPNQSWGPEQEEHPWLAVHFGRKVRVDRVELVLRADFPHDETWKHAVLVADGKEVASFDLKHEAKVQTVRFPAVACEKLELRDLEWRNKGWCALTEMRVWGADVAR